MKQFFRLITLTLLLVLSGTQVNAQKKEKTKKVKIAKNPKQQARFDKQKARKERRAKKKAKRKVFKRHYKMQGKATRKRLKKHRRQSRRNQRRKAKTLN